MHKRAFITRIPRLGADPAVAGLLTKAPAVVPADRRRLPLFRFFFTTPPPNPLQPVFPACREETVPALSIFVKVFRSRDRASRMCKAVQFERDSVFLGTHKCFTVNAVLCHAVALMENRVLADRYRLISKLGEGGMGSVWRAEHLTLHTHVAVKLIDSQIAESQQATLRFEREAQAAAELRSTHIVQILDYGVDGHTPYIVMELLEGESLATRLERLGTLSMNDLVAILSQVVRALTRAHQRGIVHRDLKPDNIFIVREDHEEVVKVLDFGIAKKLQSLTVSDGVKTHTGMVLGTPYYMSPEQALGATDIDYRTDIWSLGVIACQCLTGRRPFDRDTLTALLMAICHETMAKPSDLGAVPAGFDEWYARAVARDKAVRFESVASAVEQLRELDGNGSLLALAVDESGSARADVPEHPQALPHSTLGGPRFAETANPASLTLRDRSLRSPRPWYRIWVVPALLLLAIAGYAVQHWVLQKPVAAASQAPLPNGANSLAVSRANTAAAQVPAEPALVPIAPGSALSAASDAVLPALEAPSARPPTPRAPLKPSPPQVAGPASKRADSLPAPQPRRSTVHNTSNAAGF